MRQSDIVRSLGVAETTVSKATIWYKELGYEGVRPGQKRKRTVNTFRIRNFIKKRVDRNPKTSMRKIARDIGVSPSSVRHIAKDELGQGSERILFTDEKLFTVEQAHNRQSDRIWSTEAPDTSIVECCQNTQSVMVWGRIRASGKTSSYFVDRGVKIEPHLYRRNILEAVILPWARQHSATLIGRFNRTLRQCIEHSRVVQGQLPRLYKI
ncbi:unnamed protein product [Heligmosomoides polygyrus]|uniref:HTH_Tnp_Tc3_2 domain-containing protein n=1 Tax=Heligmosomoides polygyrus TaxID=6339 RepID=A0A183FML0_HELPZ|nr:unnamed protein product [Heligmosomoides polygyrus]